MPRLPDTIISSLPPAFWGFVSSDCCQSPSASQPASPGGNAILFQMPTRSIPTLFSSSNRPRYQGHAGSRCFAQPSAFPPHQYSYQLGGVNFKTSAPSNASLREDAAC
ncbi:hypothetical protein N658DRAFT_494134 [Parathielavia hyrcaniae]|uniref:Uncharacterized protein n=1 Tax=Parathielavia hyrcaniae TaxID=113614 RepID=A0AAN6T3D3_9PEZI|nr:hypothetical protein N658DRAFT_494134 [Parathielavia hyrcaniae]